MALVNTGGQSVWSAVVPNDGSTLGVSLYVQGGVADPGVNALGVALSNACELKIGGK